MKKLLVIFFVVVVTNISFSAKSIDLPKHYKFPKNYFEGKHYDSVKDFFLIATEKIRDSRFEKTVILMLEHDEKGALGIVINKPLGKITLGSLISTVDDPVINKKKLYDVKIPIYWGGPVDNNTILILHSNDYNNETTKKYNNLSTSSDLKTLVKIAEKKGPKKSLVILGISAWNIGQLDGEIELERWTLSETSIDLIFDIENKKKWLEAINNSFIRL
ncbi:MAG: YqgE/AlgH family protein [Pelagibacterales bacterium]|nr:YqgE/AlgH family protein [Pelagibacterales bacterium]